MKLQAAIATTRPLWFEAALLPDGWERHVRMLVTAGRIVEVMAGTAPLPGDERHAIALPGLPNVHSHAFQRALAGLTETSGTGPDSFWTWRERMYQFVDRLQPDDLEAITALAYLEMLETGFTQVGEFHYLHHAVDGSPYADPAEHAVRIVAAADLTGMGLTLLPVLYAQGGFGGVAPSRTQRRFVNDVAQFDRLLDASRQAARHLKGAVVGVAAHSLRAVTPSQLRELIGLAGSAPIHLHVAEQMREVTECLATLGARPVEWLLREHAVDARWCLVHATHMTPAERAALACSGAIVGLCPITEANLGDGIPDVADYLQRGGAIGIGSDSNVLIDAAEELRLLEYSQRLQGQLRNVLASSAGSSTGRSLFDAVHAGGSRALGISAGGFAVGEQADIVTLDAAHPSLVERSGDALLDSWIFAGRSGVVDCVWRAGHKLVTHGRHRARDTVVSRYAEALRRLLG